MRFALPLAVFAVLGAVFLAALRMGDPSRLPSALIGKPVPVTQLPPIDGMALPGISPADLAGRVAIVNVWASWCVPCAEEAPVLARLKAAAGVPLLGINYKDAPENARRFLGAYGNPFDAVGQDSDGRAAIEWGVYGVPETYLVNAGGQLIYRFAGPVTTEIMEHDLLPRIAAARRGG